MSFSLKAIMEALGPNSALIFAAWIFMSFLQQRYLAALDRYRALIGEIRDGTISGDRRENVSDQVALYKHRCELMKQASSLGLMAAIFLILALIAAAISVVLGSSMIVDIGGALLAVAGLLLIIIAAAIAMKENSIIQRIVDGELLDVPDLARRTGQKPGAITDHQRHL